MRAKPASVRRASPCRRSESNSARAALLLNGGWLVTGPAGALKRNDPPSALIDATAMAAITATAVGRSPDRIGVAPTAPLGLTEPATGTGRGR